jgi:hypothetical protein
VPVALVVLVVLAGLAGLVGLVGLVGEVLVSGAVAVELESGVGTEAWAVAAS